MSESFPCDWLISRWNVEKTLIIDTDTETPINKKIAGFW